MHDLLNQLAIPHVYRDGPQRKHDWHSGWVEEAVGLLLNPQANTPSIHRRRQETGFCRWTRSSGRSVRRCRQQGTEAAAANAVVIEPTAAPFGPREPHQPVMFRADDPFLLPIGNNRTGGVLLMGRVLQPQA